MAEKDTDKPGTHDGSDNRSLPEAAKRALREAEERRRRVESAKPPEEKGGRGGLDPVRYGDWERKGLISDF